MATDTELDELLSGYSGEKVPSFGFRSIGDKIVGTVTRRSIVETVEPNQPEKRKNLVLDIQTDSPLTQVRSDGQTVTSDRFTLWVKAPSQQLSALTEALKAAGAPPGSPKAGDRVACEWFDSEPSKKNLSPKKLYRWQYKAGAPAVVNSVDDLL